jgi:EpsI family protein
MPRHIIFAAVLALLAAAAGPVYAMVIDARPAPPLADALSTPKPGGGWRLAGLSSGGWSPRYPNAHIRLSRTYVKDGREVRLFIAYYNHQRQGAEMIGGRNSVLGVTGWTRAAASAVGVRLGPRALDVKRVRLVRRGRGRIAYQWYWIANKQTPNVYLAKFLQTRQVLLGASEAAAVIIISSEYRNQADDADPVLRDFMANLPPVESWLGRAARGG